MSGPRPLLSAALLAGLTLAPLARAIVASPAARSASRPAGPAAAAATPQSLAEAILKADTPEAAAALRERLRAEKPVTALAPLLGDGRLAVRLAALEVLEELAGKDFGYDAWTAPDAPENAEPLARWKTWAATGKTGAPGAGRADDATLRGYLNDTLGDDEARRDRARRMLLRQGRAALAVLEKHRRSNPEFSDVAKARLDEARYAIVLHDTGVAAAGALARDLAFGSRDRRIEALGALRAAGPGVLPVVAEFLGAREPLVRETAVECFMALGGEAAHETVAERVKLETDDNVLHAILRGLSEKRSEAGTGIAHSLLRHADEEIVCGALECLCPKGASEKPDAATLTRIRELAGDARWRLRAAALDAVARMRLGKESALILKALDDPDPFVRAAAIRAAAETKCLATVATLEKLADLDDDTQMPAVRALRALGKPVPESLAKRIPTMDRDRVLNWLTASQGVQEERIHPPQSTLVILAASPDADIAGAALAALLEQHGRDPETLALATSALLKVKPAELAALIGKFPVTQGGKAASQRTRPAVARVNDSPEIDSIFSALLTPGAPRAGAATPPSATPEENDRAKDAPASAADAADTLLRPYLKHADPAVRRAALLHFAASADKDAVLTLAAEWPRTDDDERLRLAEKLGIPATPEGVRLLEVMLADPIAAIRKNALGHISGESDELRRAAFAAFTGKEPRIHPAEVLEALQWQLEYNDRKSDWPDTVGLTLLRVESPPERLVLGLILAGHAVSKLPDDQLAAWTGHADPLVRRAAWFAVVRHAPIRAARALDAIVADRDAAVRITATRLALPVEMTWEQRISPGKTIPLTLQSYRNPQPPVSRRLPAALAKLLDDPDAAVRFDSALSLLAIGKPVEVARFTEILRAQSDAVAARKRVASLVNAGGDNLPEATLRTLAGFLDANDLDSSARTRLSASSGAGKKGATAVTFADLAGEPEAPAVLEGVKAPAPEAKPPVATRSGSALVVFVKAGCRECDRVESLLRTLRAGDPTLVIHRHLITDTHGILLNRHLADKRGLPEKEIGRTPAVFGRDAALVGDAITGAALEKLAVAGKSGPADDTWTKLPESEKAAVAAKVQQTFAGLSLAVILGAGLLDGLNPCAFATLIFLISYLQVARRSPREILLVGGAFVSAVYLTYFAIGLGLHGLLGALAGLSWMRAVINLGFAALALGLAVFSLRDGLLARAGRLRDMNLQLPGWIKDRVRGVIREGAKARHFVAFAFFSGIVISVLELACTGQVYAPIVNQIRQGSMNAVGALAAYNAAFVLPLLVVFALAYGGLRSEALIRFQAKHTATVRFATAAIFLTLALLLFAAEWRTIRAG